MLEVRTFPAHVLIRVYLDYDFGWSNVAEDTVLSAASGHQKQILLDLDACNQIDTHGLLSLSRLHVALGNRLNIIMSDGARVAPIVEASGMLDALPIIRSLPRRIDVEAGVA